MNVWIILDSFWIILKAFLNVATLIWIQHDNAFILNWVSWCKNIHVFFSACSISLVVPILMSIHSFVRQLLISSFQLKRMGSQSPLGGSVGFTYVLTDGDESCLSIRQGRHTGWYSTTSHTTTRVWNTSAVLFLMCTTRTKKWRRKTSLKWEQ